MDLNTEFTWLEEPILCLSRICESIVRAPTFLPSDLRPYSTLDTQSLGILLETWDRINKDRQKDKYPVYDRSFPAWFKLKFYQPRKKYTDRIANITMWIIPHFWKNLCGNITPFLFSYWFNISNYLDIFELIWSYFVHFVDLCWFYLIYLASNQK